MHSTLVNPNKTWHGQLLLVHTKNDRLISLADFAAITVAQKTIKQKNILPARDPKQCGGAKGDETIGGDDDDRHHDDNTLMRAHRSKHMRAHESRNIRANI